MARSFNLSGSDWHEIWNCCEENIQDKLHVDGFGTSKKQIATLTDEDWTQIYLSVKEKRDRLRSGFYGKDATAREWKRQMNDIVETLEPLAEEFGCASCGKLHGNAH